MRDFRATLRRGCKGLAWAVLALCSSGLCVAQNVSMQFDAIEVRSALQLLARLSKTSIVVSDSVSGSMSVQFDDVPWQEALDSISQARGLLQRQTGRVIWVAPEHEILEREQQQLARQNQATQARDESGKLMTRSFRLSHVRAVELERQIMAQNAPTSTQAGAVTLLADGSERVLSPAAARKLGAAQSQGDLAELRLPLTPAPLLSETGLMRTKQQAGDASAAYPDVGGNARALAAQARQSSRLLSSRGSILADARSNQLVVTDTQERLDVLAEVIQLLDRPMQQVQIEARIVEASSSWGRNLGIRFGAQQVRQDNSGRTTTLAGGLAQQQIWDGSAASIAGVVPAAVAFSIVNPALSQMLNIEISALEANGQGQLLASPRIVTADQQKAVIEQGTELPYQLQGKDGQTQLQFRRALLRLEVTPRITPAGGIVLDLLINRDTVGRSTAAGPAIDTRHVQSQVLVENGGTIAIGGIFETVERTEQSKIPLLGDIPVLGALFRRSEKSEEKTELHIFVTPRLIDSQGGLH